MRLFQSRWFAAILALVVLLAAAFAFQGARGIWQPDEGYYVGTALTMSQSGDLLVPRLGEAIFLEKPPLMYWGILSGLKLIGHTEFGARAFGGLCFFGTSAIVGLLGWSLFGNRQDGIAAALIYATMAVPFVAANFVTADTPLALWTALAALFFWKSAKTGAKRVRMWQMLMCAALGIGFLAKGPAVLIPCAGMFVYLLIQGNIRRYFLTPWALLGACIFSTLGLGWYAYVSLRVEGAASYFFDNQIWGRLVSHEYHRNPDLTDAVIYLPVLLFGSLPWSFVWLGHATRLNETVASWSWWKQLRGQPVKAFLLAWFFVPLLVLCLASSKLGFYALPLFAPLALATSRLWTRKFERLARCDVVRDPRILLKPAGWCAVWVSLLVGSRLILAYYPTENDSRHLWAHIKPHIPTGDYEILTIDEHADGLLFYGAKEVENTTMEDSPYPTFVPPENLADELSELTLDNHAFLIVVRKADHIDEVTELIKSRNVCFTTVELPFDRKLLICQPPQFAWGVP